MAITLEKRTEAATTSLVNLLKKEADKGIDLGELTAQVVIAIDYSGSMGYRYQGNPSEVQTAVERSLALSLSGLDDDGVVPVHFFHADAFAPILVDDSNYHSVVSDFTSKNRMGGTNFTPTIKDILGEGDSPSPKQKKRFGRNKVVSAPINASANEKDEPPTLVLFITDGVPMDGAQTEQLLIKASGRPFFWQFIGLGSDMAFVDKLDKGLKGREVDNVGVTKFDNTANMTDEQFFNDIIGEFFTKWLPEARKKGITNK